MLFSRKKKKVRFFILSKKDNIKQFLTITTDKKDCLEYFKFFMRATHEEHFRAWADIRGLDYKKDEVFDEYFKTIPDEEKDEYLILPVYYTMDNLSAIVRMFGGSVPLGCSFNTPTEYEYLKSKFQREQYLEKVFTEYLKLHPEEKLPEDEVNGK